MTAAYLMSPEGDEEVVKVSLYSITSMRVFFTHFIIGLQQKEKLLCTVKCFDPADLPTSHFHNKSWCRL
ncbi:hypothetical protein OUZ56_022019 [Daphnia magna]|uniref:Uncharacterized protein n=1 Tax=Daphnia magna TaxID=35525 RepID=A0ABR0AV76_9CRUS|nr:hypothetical protein OUZ56_022019 [Daphnia magna]